MTSSACHFVFLSLLLLLLTVCGVVRGVVRGGGVSGEGGASGVVRGVVSGSDEGFVSNGQHGATITDTPLDQSWTKMLLYWNRTLQRHVQPQRHKHNVPLALVDYDGISKDQDFANFINAIADINTSTFSKNETYAFWINVYNALVIKTIIQNRCQNDIFGECGGCINSVRDIGTFLRPVWELDVAVVGGKWHSLSSVESILRNPVPYTQDPRLHGSIVKGCVSTPDLPRHAFSPAEIDAQMDVHMRQFLSNTQKGLFLNKKNKTITVSRIFEWYAADFESASLHAGGEGTVLDYILNFLDGRGYAKDTAETIDRLAYFDFDWDLNVLDNNGNPALPRGNKCNGRPCFWLWAVFVTISGAALMVFVLGSVAVYKLWKHRSQRDHFLQQAEYGFIDQSNAAAASSMCRVLNAVSSLNLLGHSAETGCILITAAGCGSGVEGSGLNLTGVGGGPSERGGGGGGLALSHGGSSVMAGRVLLFEDSDYTVTSASDSSGASSGPSRELTEDADSSS